MRFILVAAALAVSLVSAASAPRAAGAPLRQVTRAELVRRQAKKGLGRRQSQPSNGVYPTCETGGQDGTVSAVVANVTPTNPGTLLLSVQTDNAQACAQACDQYAADNSAAPCLAGQFETATGNCDLYSAFTSATSNTDFTTSFRTLTCAEINSEASGTITCCNYYPTAA